MRKRIEAGVAAVCAKVGTEMTDEETDGYEYQLTKARKVSGQRFRGSRLCHGFGQGIRSSQTGDQIIKACSRHDEYTWFFRPRLADCCAIPSFDRLHLFDLRSAKIMRWLRPKLGKPLA